SVFIKTLLEMPELRDGKLSCAVLRGRKLPDISPHRKSILKKALRY
ncbi:hypothetical protein SAMN03080601_03602, partial [Alkalitalea saponilacus]